MRKSMVFVCAVFAMAAAGLAARGQQDNAREGRQGQGQAAQQGHDMMKADREVAVGHALSMAIEGSTLWSSAQEARAQSGLRGTTRGGAGATGDPAAALEKHARDGFSASHKLFQAAQNDRGGDQNEGQQRFLMAAMRYAQALEGMSQGAVGGSGIGTGRSSAPTGSGINNAPGASGRDATGGADRATDTSGRRSGGPQDAGQDTRTTSPRLGGAGGGARSDAQIGEAAGTARERAATAGITGGMQNKGQIALLNHAVKEAVDGVMLRKMIRHHDDNDQVAQALRQHADMMLQGSREALSEAEAAGGGTRREAARPTNEQFNRNPGEGVGTTKPGAGASAGITGPGVGAKAKLGGTNVGASANVGGTTVGASANLARPGANLEQDAGAGQGGDLVTLAREVIDSVRALDQEGDQAGGQRINRAATGREAGTTETRTDRASDVENRDKSER